MSILETSFERRFSADAGNLADLLTHAASRSARRAAVAQESSGAVVGSS